MVERILYGVQGEGRGHAARSLQVIQWLMTKGYRVKVMTGGDALKVLEGQGLDMEEIPMFRYQFGANGSLSPWRTIHRNAGRALGLLFGLGSRHDRVRRITRDFRPGLIISDFEPYLSRIASRAGIPLLAIDHQHFLTESVLPPVHGWHNAVMLKVCQWATSLMAGRPDRIITSSFYHFPKKRNSRAVFVGPFIPGRLKGPRCETDRSVTVYLKQPGYLDFLLFTMAQCPERSFVVFSDWKGGAQPCGLPANVRIAPIDRDAFLAQLSRGEALITTAGNQVIGEAVFLRKPILAFPEPDVLEQELNSLALKQSGFGECFRIGEFTLDRWNTFEAGIEIFRSRMAGYFRRRAFDGRRQALRALRRFIREIPAGPAPRRKSRHSFAR